MKFSYTLLKKYLPNLPSKKKVIKALNLYSFESEEDGENAIEISIPSNRYSDAASHFGVALEAKTALGLKKDGLPNISFEEGANEGESGNFSVDIKDKKLCRRYTAQYFENVKVGPSPKWIKKVLEECGLQSVNNVVDIMNYVMLEIGQPLHAFDFDKISGEKKKKIIIKEAGKKDKITTIDGEVYELDEGELVIADSKGPLAIAGIKGGKEAEVSKTTKRILVESANFDGASIYRSSKKLGLVTDAAVRFSHNLNTNLALAGLNRVEELLSDLVGVKRKERFDSTSGKPRSRDISFDIGKFKEFAGIDITKKKTVDILRSLRFGFEGNKVTVPVLRDDINTFEDVSEEVVRMIGFNNIKSTSPVFSIKPSVSDDVFSFRDRVRDIIINFGYSEVYNSSFNGEKSKGSIKIENPISEDKRYLRAELGSGLVDNVYYNLKFFDSVRIFETGKIFKKNKGKILESNKLGIACGTNNDNDYSFFEVKGVVDQALKGLGLVDFWMVESDISDRLRIESNNYILGEIYYYKGVAVCEMDFGLLKRLVNEEISFRPLPKFPAVQRDVTAVVDVGVKIGELIQEIQLSNLELIRDVDLIDEYIGNKKEERQSITLRVVFRSDEKTLTKKEVDGFMNKITDILQEKFGASIK